MKNENVRSILVQVNKWIFKHEIISSSIFALLIGLAVGGVSTVLYSVIG